LRNETIASNSASVHFNENYFHDSTSANGHFEFLNQLDDNENIKVKDFKSILQQVLAQVNKPSYTRENLEKKIAFTFDKELRIENHLKINEMHTQNGTVPASLYFFRFPRPINDFADDSDYLDKYNEIIRKCQTSIMELNRTSFEESKKRVEIELLEYKNDLAKYINEHDANRFFEKTQRRVEEELKSYLRSKIQKVNSITYQKFRMRFNDPNRNESSSYSENSSRSSRSSSNSAYAPRRPFNNNKNQHQLQGQQYRQQEQQPQQSNQSNQRQTHNNNNRRSNHGRRNSPRLANNNINNNNNNNRTESDSE
jgi:uncharacterized protein YxeA